MAVFSEIHFWLILPDFSHHTQDTNYLRLLSWPSQEHVKNKCAYDSSLILFSSKDAPDNSTASHCIPVLNRMSREVSGTKYH